MGPQTGGNQGRAAAPPHERNARFHMISRRSFLAAAWIIPPTVAILAPEMVRRSFFLPPAGGWRPFDASQYLTSPHSWYFPDYPFIEIGVESRDGQLQRYRRIVERVVERERDWPKVFV
jgi:hypothetical protein